MPLRTQVLAGIVAGLVGAVTIDVCLFGAQLLEGAPASAVVATYVFIASAMLGPAAYANPGAAAIGIAMHVAVAIGWALGYVYLVRTQPQLLTRPIISGAAFGLVVWICMQVVLITAGLYHRASDPRALAVQLLAHIVFYGIPVALIVSAMVRRADATAASAGRTA